MENVKFFAKIDVSICTSDMDYAERVELEVLSEEIKNLLKDRFLELAKESGHSIKSITFD